MIEFSNKCNKKHSLCSACTFSNEYLNLFRSPTFEFRNRNQKLITMNEQNLILDKLSEIASKLSEQSLLQKTVLNFNDTCIYLDVSPSHLYKLTSTKQIPHFCPQGKKLYFKREEMDAWLQRNRQNTALENELEASDNLIRSNRRK